MRDHADRAQLPGEVGISGGLIGAWTVDPIARNGLLVVGGFLSILPLTTLIDEE